MSQCNFNNYKNDLFISDNKLLFDYLKNKTGNSPVLLMDDIFDKLDILRVKRIVNIVNSTNFGQLFISDTDKDRVEKVLSSLNISSKIFDVWKEIIS